MVVNGAGVKMGRTCARKLEEGWAKIGFGIFLALLFCRGGAESPNCRKWGWGGVGDTSWKETQVGAESK